MSDANRRSSWWAPATALFLVVAACGGGGEAGGDASASSPTTVHGSDGSAAGATTETTATPGTSADGLPSGPSALRVDEAPEFPDPLVDPSLILSGGPPPDGIPPIDEPQFVGVDEAGAYLAAEEPVIALEIDSDARAYPVQVMVWHEIVNDTVGGVPVAVTYCPLCNSAVTYERVVRGEETTFGTSGRLYASALVMYDRATESLWTHFDGLAVVGVLAGERLTPVPSPLMAWSEFAEAYPDGRVLDRERTGRARAYGVNPYQGYDRPDGAPYGGFFPFDADERAALQQRVVGVVIGDDAKAWILDELAQGAASATNDRVGDTPLAIFWKEGQASALETGEVAGGRDVGSVTVFDARLGDRALTFVADGASYVDRETGSRWTLFGEAVEGPLAGESLTQIHHLDTFWFAWSTYQPGTELVGA